MIIEYPKHISEFDTQAKLYSVLKEKGFDVFGELVIRDSNGKKGYKQFRFDLVVFENKIAKYIIEVKTDGTPEINKKHRQYKKYSLFNLPIIYCYGDKDIEKVVREVKK
jgi:hypothetical protein